MKKYPHVADPAYRHDSFLRATMMHPNTNMPIAAHTCPQTNGFVAASKITCGPINVQLPISQFTSDTIAEIAVAAQLTWPSVCVFVLLYAAN